MAGFKSVAGIDFDEDSVKTYERNFPKANALCGNLLDFSEIKIKKIFKGQKIDVIIGGPPCQGFSNANRWSNDSADPRNKLFYEYLKFVKVLKPEAVVIENVRGILSKNGGYAAQRISKLVEEYGYHVAYQVLNASDYGVPQNRYRAFFVAVRNDVTNDSFNFDQIKKSARVSVKDAIGELYSFEKSKSEVKNILRSPNSSFRKFVRSTNNNVPNHEIVYPAAMTQKRISHVPQGGNWQDIPVTLFANNRSNRHSSAYKRLDEKDVSVTIDTGNAHSNYFHPKFDRIPTVREAARLQSFPDYFVFEGARSSQYRQVGNAVPPLLAKSIASQLMKLIK
jgi:DNA (cytosine-5)-methyltransferase 1